MVSSPWKSIFCVSKAKKKVKIEKRERWKMKEEGVVEEAEKEEEEGLIEEAKKGEEEG